MRRKLTLSVAALLLTAAISLGLCIPTAAAQDPMADFALEYLQAVRDGKTETEICISDVDDFEVFLKQVFERYPVLFHYYAGAQWRSYPTETVVTCRLQNLDDPAEEISVVRTEDELMAVLGLGLARADQEVIFVCPSGFAPDTDLISAQFERLRHEHYLSFMGYHGYSFSYVTWDTGIRAYRLTYDYFYDLSAQTVRQWRAEAEAVAVNLAQSLFAADMPDYERVLRIHDWVINNTRYNTRDRDEPGNNLAYGALVKGSCVCQGYAEAFLVLAKAAGLETMYVVGDATNSLSKTESHAWNAVKVQDEWYMIDLTWDDPTTSDGSDVLQYDYFLVSGQQLAADHSWVQADYPACNGTALDADWVLSQSAQEGTVYVQYDGNAVKTQAESAAELSAMLADPQLPTEHVKPPTVLPEPTENLTTDAVLDPDFSQQDQSGHPSDPDTKKGNGIGLMVGILLLLVVLISAVGAAVWFIGNRNRSPRYHSNQNVFGSGPSYGRPRKNQPRNAHRRVQW